MKKAFTLIALIFPLFMFSQIVKEWENPVNLQIKITSIDEYKANYVKGKGITMTGDSVVFVKRLYGFKKRICPLSIGEYLSIDGLESDVRGKIYYRRIRKNN